MPQKILKIFAKNYCNNFLCAYNTNQHNVDNQADRRMKMEHVYDAFIVGYIVTTKDGRSANFQFVLNDSNHPQPKHYLASGCQGDDTYLQFTEEELCEMSDYLESQEDVRETLNAFNKAFYRNGGWDMPYPLEIWQILEAAEGEE